MSAECVIIEFCDYRATPIGGQLSFARNILEEYGGQFDYVGLGRLEEPVGKWHVRSDLSEGARFFFVGPVHRSTGKPLVPMRLRALWMCLRWRKELAETRGKVIIVQSPEALLVAWLIGAKKVVYRFAGVDNPVRYSRYRVLRLLAGVFESTFERLLASVAFVFVTADRHAVEAMATRMRRIGKAPVVWLPTSYDERLFYPQPDAARGSSNRFLYVGRLSEDKCCDLLIRAFSLFNVRHPEAQLEFLGDGEAKSDLVRQVGRLGLGNSIRFLGARPQVEIAELMRQSAAFVFASRREGWPTVLVEAAASGLFIVTSNVSGADDIVEDGVTGVIVSSWSEQDFAAAFEAAWKRRTSNPVSRRGIGRFSKAEMRRTMDAALEYLASRDATAGKCESC